MKGETSAVVEANGHLIDSGLLNTIFDAVIAHEGAFEVQRFEIGRTNNDASELVLRVSASSSEQLDRILEALLPLGCAPVVQTDALIRHADMFERSHQRMVGVVEVLRRVLVLRRIAAADVAAHEAQPQVQPPVAAPQAFFAPVRARGRMRVLVTMLTRDRHWQSPRRGRFRAAAAPA